MAVAAPSATIRSFSAAMSPSRRLRERMIVRSTGPSVVPILTNLQNTCTTPLPVLRRVADSMTADLRAGLAQEGSSDLKMILSYVDSLPTGDEKGIFYALDLGGTNFRVLRVQLGGKDKRVIDSEFEQVTIPQELMFGTSEELFDFIAMRLANFARKEGGRLHLPNGRKGEIGFTFSFPIKQTSIDSGTLIKWTKGFAVSGTAGKDVVACLNESMERQGVEMHVSALLGHLLGQGTGMMM
ncbi:hexokinase-2, chloroplastic-like isoform X3 [Macadamia integrifolia]|uniref:hexokinase-2, chloroplastic-like isoform X3 n=1 Tax=Macadamia integrifolia TaxID=60698 RepID=UPI001C4E73A0|nr:hexokinase-2, chloroplastic-like isoform X3 [Macadamia integrifolia]